MIHHLQQQVKHFRVRLLDFIEQQHTMRVLVDCFCQQTALVIAHIARRGTDQARYSMSLHVFRHIKAYKLDTEHLGQLLGDLSLTNPCRAGKQKRTFGLLRRFQASASQLDGGRQGFNGRILPEHHHFKIPLQIPKQVFVAGGDILRRNPRNAGNYIFDVSNFNRFLALVFRLQALTGARLINHIDRLVRQVPVGDVTVRQFRRHPEGLVGIGQIVMFFEARLQPFQNLISVFNTGLIHINFLEATRQRTVFLEDAPEFLECR